MTVKNLTEAEIAEQTASYMKRTTVQLRSLARLNGIDAANMTKAQLAGAIIANSRRAEVIKPAFDYTGLVIRTGVQA